VNVLRLLWARSAAGVMAMAISRIVTGAGTMRAYAHVHDEGDA
jgi:hypothetical protein